MDRFETIVQIATHESPGENLDGARGYYGQLFSTVQAGAVVSATEKSVQR
jgi:hypothetical protein